MTDWNDAAYRELEKEANKDNRVGKHLFVVTEKREDTWPSGDPRVKLLGQLVTANSAKADVTLSPPPSPEEVKAESSSWDSRKKKAIAQSIAIHRNLAKFYDGKTPETIEAGDEFSVETAKNKEGFVRVVAFLPKGAHEAKTGEGKAKNDESIPF